MRPGRYTMPRKPVGVLWMLAAVGMVAVMALAMLGWM